MLLPQKGLKNKRIRRPRNEIEPEEVLWDAFALKKENSSPQRRMEVPLSSPAMKGLGLIFLLLIILVLGKTFQYQVLNHKTFSVLAQKNQFIINDLEAERGVIYDRNFKQLVTNKPSFNLVVKKSDLPRDPDKRAEVFEKIAWILGQEKEKVEEEVDKQSENQFILAPNLDYQKLILLETNAEDISGFTVKNVGVREYKEGPYFSHIIGYHRQSGQNSGLEDFYNKFLASKPGEIKSERDAYGNIISENIITSPRSGDSLVLWVDAGLQEKLYQTMAEQIKKAGVKRASAVAIDPKTGGILALVSFPSFDNNLFSQGINQEQWDILSHDKNMPFLNRVIAGKYPVGSTIKPLLAAAALQEGIITKRTTVNCKGEIVVDNPWFPDKPFTFKDWKAHGITDVKKAIAESCNVFFYTVGGGYKDFKGLGVEKIKKYLSIFGWDEKMGIDLPGEMKGFIPDKEWKKKAFSSPDNIWMPGDTYHLSIGQGFIAATPLEVVSSFAAIANGGKLLKPQVVHEIVNKNREVVKEFKPVVIRQNFIDEKNLKIVREGMRGTVEYGSAVVLNDLPVAAAAKTGTAEISKENHYHSWLTVFAPYDDPQIVLTLMVEEGFGMHVAVAPTAHEVLNWYFGGKKSSESDSFNSPKDLEE